MYLRTLPNKVLKDWHLLVGIVVVVSVVVVLLLIGLLVPQLRPSPKTIPDAERGDGVDVRMYVCMYVCMLKTPQIDENLSEE